MSRFYNRAQRVRHRIRRQTNESKAKMLASRAFNKDTPEWEVAYEAKLKEFNLNDQLALVKDAQFSISLNKDINLNNYNF